MKPLPVRFMLVGGGALSVLALLCPGVARTTQVVPAPMVQVVDRGVDRGKVDRTVTRADVVGTWRRMTVTWVDWDSVTNALSPQWREVLLTLRPDGTYTVRGWATGKKATPLPNGFKISDSVQTTELNDEEWERMFSGKTGKWSLKGDTLVTGVIAGVPVEYKLTHTDSTLTIQRVDSKRWESGEAIASEWQRVDATKPVPAAPSPLPPLTLTRAQLAGTWVAPISELLMDKPDTVVLRADGTWAADGHVRNFDAVGVGNGGKDTIAAVPGDWIIAGCTFGLASAARGSDAKASEAGTWYLGPANTVVFVDTLRRQVCGQLGRWRGSGAVKLQGQQLMPQGESVYTRIGDAAP